jgi:hypothetical protein
MFIMMTYFFPTSGQTVQALCSIRLMIPKHRYKKTKTCILPGINPARNINTAFLQILLLTAASFLFLIIRLQGILLLILIS